MTCVDKVSSLCYWFICLFIICIVEVTAAFSNKESVQKEVKASLSQKVTLSCEVSDSKTDVKWYKDGKLLTSSKAVHMESKGKSRELVIEKMEKKDAGEYTCEAGTEKLVFKLQVTGKINYSWYCANCQIGHGIDVFSPLN